MTGAVPDIRPQIQTERLSLRPVQTGDADNLAAYLGDFGVSRSLGRVPHPYAREQAVNWIAASQIPRPADDTGFVLDLGEGLIGGIGFRSEDGVPNLGYWLAKPYWGQGLMSEAAAAVLAWLFEVSDHNLVRSGVFEGNSASLRILQKLGFEVTGHSLVNCLAQDTELPNIDTELKRNSFRPPDPKQTLAQ